MKKKMLSILMSASVLMSFAPVNLSVTAETTEENGNPKYISVPVNLVENGWYNNERTYWTSGNVGIVSDCISFSMYSDAEEKEIVGEDGSTSTVLSRTKTSAKGHLSIDGTDFMGRTDLWKKSWDEVLTNTSTARFTNTLSFDGVDYEISLPFTNKTFYPNAGSKYPTLVRTSSIAGSATTGYYNTYDIEDGYYKGVSFLGGAYGNNATSSSSYNDPYIRYVYSDGTKSNWVKLNAPPINPKRRSSSETAPYIALKSNLFAGDKATKTVTEQTSSDNGVTWTDGEVTTNTKALDADKTVAVASTFYLNKIDELTADGTKKMTAIEVIARNGEVQNDLSLDPVYNSSNKYKYGLDFIGMTLLTDEECANNGYIADLKPIWEQKPDTFTGTSEDITWLEGLNSAFEKINLDLVSDSETYAMLNEIDKYIADVKNYTVPVYRYLEPSDFANRANWFLEEGDTATPGANENSYGFEPQSFKALNTEDAYWENDWTEGMTENILTFRDYKYKINVDTTAGNYVAFKAYRPNIDGGKNSPPGDISSEDDLYYRFKVPTGYYEGISFLGGIDYRSEMLAAVRLNYSDGSTSFVDVDLLQFTTKGTKEDYIKLDRTTLDSETGKVAKTGSSLYLHQVNLTVDPTRVLESIDLPIQSAFITDGEITGDGNNNYARYNYSFAGIGLKTNKYLTSKIPCVTSVKTTNDGKTAKVSFNFEQPITEEIYKKSSFTLYKDNVDSGITLSKSKKGDEEIIGIELSFPHDMDFDAVWKIEAEIENLGSYTAYAPLKAPSEISNVVFTDGVGNTVSDLDNVTDSFTVSADVNNIGEEKLYLALYNGNTLCSFDEANVINGKLTNSFDVSDVEGKSLTLKAYAWDSLSGMKPQNMVQDITGIKRLEERRNTAEAYMKKVITTKWRADKDIIYTLNDDTTEEELDGLDINTVSSFKIHAGRVYQGQPYAYAGAVLASFLDYSDSVDENGVYNVSGIDWTKLNGGFEGSRVGSDCTPTLFQSWGQFGVQVAENSIWTWKLCEDYGYLKVGNYEANPARAESEDCHKNAPEVMYEAYARLKKADALNRRNDVVHVIMATEVNVVRKNDGSIDEYNSYIIFQEQTRKHWRANKKYYDEELGEYVYVIGGADLKYTFKDLYKDGYMPFTVKELRDQTPIAPPVVSDSITEYNKDTMFEGTIESTWFIDCVAVVITDINGETVKSGALTTSRSSYNKFNMKKFVDMDSSKINGTIDIESLTAGDYNCKVICRLTTGEEVTVRDFDFSV